RGQRSGLEQAPLAGKVLFGVSAKLKGIGGGFGALRDLAAIALGARGSFGAGFLGASRSLGLEQRLGLCPYFFGGLAFEGEEVGSLRPSRCAISLNVSSALGPCGSSSSTSSPSRSRLSKSSPAGVPHAVGALLIDSPQYINQGELLDDSEHIG